VSDARVGRAARALRHRLRLPQREAARRAGLGQSAFSRLERGLIEGLTVGRLRRMLAVFDAEAVILVRWRGGEIDRLIDRGHAALAEAVTRLLESDGWAVAPEVSFAHFGERGSIDLLGWHAASRRLLVVELKTELTSVEETLRRHDVKVRLAARVARDRVGWDAVDVDRLLAFPPSRTVRRHLDRVARVFGRAYPARGWAVRRWLRAPSGPLAGILFVSASDGVTDSRSAVGRRRIRMASRAPGAAAVAPGRANASSGGDEVTSLSRTTEAGRAKSHLASR
jgi:transcriptional regulator with XRE-family HTH domain